MYVDTETIINAAKFLGALGVIVSAIVTVYKTLESNKRQSAEINAIKEEQTILCYAVQGTLQGLIEQGCDGPCKEALNILQKHLNKTAHKPDL